MIRFLQTPGRLQKTLLVGFLAIICIMMVVTLVPGGILNSGVGSDPNTIAKVGSREITIQEVRQAATGMARQQFGGRVPEQLLPLFMQQAVDTLVVQDVALDEAKRMGLEATKEELRYELQHGPLGQRLFPDGKFIGSDAYKNFVQDAFNLSVSQFEDEVRKELTLRKLRAVVESGVTVSRGEMQDQFVKSRTKVKFDYAVLTAAALGKQINPSDAELRAFYEKNQQQFANSIPEQRKARYVLVDASHLPNAPKPTNDDLQSYYRAHQDQFRVPDSVTVRHILIKTPLSGPNGKVDQNAQNAARAKAQEVLKQVKSGADFASLAKKYSEDAPTAKNGGLVGQLVQGSGTAPEIEKVAFTLSKGQTSDAIQTSYGIEIIHVDDRTSAHMKPIEAVRAQIEPIVAREKAQGAADQLARAIEADAHKKGLDKAAAEHGLKVTNTDFFARQDSLPAIGSVPAFSDAVFAQKPGAPAQAVAIPTGFAVVQVAEVKPAATPSFEQVKARIADQFRNEKAQSILAQKTQELAEKARSGHNLRAAAQAVGATVKSSELVMPGQQVPDIGPLSGDASVIFTMKPGDISGPIAAGQNGVVVSLLQKQEPTMAEFDSAKDQVREALLQRKRQEVEAVFITNLRDKMQKSGKIMIDRKRLNALTSGGQSGE